MIKQNLLILYFMSANNLSIYNHLSKIQNNLIAPKNKGKSAGSTVIKYDYRSSDDIIEKVKEIIRKEKLPVVLLIQSELIYSNQEAPLINYEYKTEKDSYGKDKIKTYITAETNPIFLNCTAKLVNTEDPKEFISANAIVKHDLYSSQMSAGQLSGATLSYAKKYALGNLFNLDDNKDLDDMDEKQKTDKKEIKKPEGINKELENMTKNTANGFSKAFGPQLEKNTKVFDPQKTLEKVENMLASGEPNSVKTATEYVQKNKAMLSKNLNFPNISNLL